MPDGSPAVGGWKLSIRTPRGDEQPVLALAADGSGIFQSPEGPLPVSATFDGDEVSASLNTRR